MALITTIFVLLVLTITPNLSQLNQKSLPKISFKDLNHNLHNPIVNQGRFTQQELRANVQQKMNKNNQSPKFVPLSNKPCPCCSYSNRDILKLL